MVNGKWIARTAWRSTRHFPFSIYHLPFAVVFVFLATVNSRGEPSCSYKGGDPGFVRVLNPTTLAFPCYDGNGMYLSMGNVAATRHVGMLFIDLCTPKRLRVNGTARIERLPAGYVDVDFPDLEHGAALSGRIAVD